MFVDGKHYRTVWFENDSVKMINQLLLPHRFEIAEIHTYQETIEAIKNMTVRGAPAIGAAGAYGMVLAANQFSELSYSVFSEQIKKAADSLKNARPTAKDLSYGVGRVYEKISEAKNIHEAWKEALIEAGKFADESAKECELIGVYGAPLMEDGTKVLTHCNAGWLATVDWGTALAPIYKAKKIGRNVTVYADETRPRMQGARLTSWELLNEGIEHYIIADNAAGYYMKEGEIDIVIVGADRVAANGDIANKIGTYEKAVLAHENHIPFYVAVPFSTFDLECLTGNDIPIEERTEDEVLYIEGKTRSGKIVKVRTTPEDVHARNPAFDVTPARYITDLITPDGIIKANKEAIEELFKRKILK